MNPVVVRVMSPTTVAIVSGCIVGEFQIKQSGKHAETVLTAMIQAASADSQVALVCPVMRGEEST